MFCPSRRTETRPTSFRTRRCLDTDGCPIPSASAMSPTVRSSNARNVRMSRRRGSATALKASDVVVARGMELIYTHIGICKAETELGRYGSYGDRPLNPLIQIGNVRVVILGKPDSPPQ